MDQTCPKLMGILNVTPDSCYDQGKFFKLQDAIDRAFAIVEEGADYLDIGGESSRPGAAFVAVDEELSRIKPLLESLPNFPIPISIDTYKPEVAKLALEKGASLLNDITGFSSPEMRKLAASAGADICVMHMQGTPKTMQQNPSYPEGVIPHLISWFEKRIELLLSDGVQLSQIIIDPGIGFGKTVEHNLEIYQNLQKLKEHFGLRILLGGSRKSFMGKILNKTYPDLLPATLVMHTIASMEGADILRIHDVKEHRDLRALCTLFV